jgi:putative ABC transport system substrate-binding protein
VDVIAAPGGVAVAQAAKAATTTIPIVFMFGADPVGIGLVASLNRPGGNITGVTTMGGEVAPKRLEVMRELLPAAKSMALLVNPTNLQTATISKELQSAANRLGLELRVVNAVGESELRNVFANWVELGASALVIANDGFFTSQIELLATLADRYAVPAIYHYREFAAAGGLMSYGASLDDPYRVAGPAGPADDES